jgi:ankyrin repeat protein
LGSDYVAEHFRVGLQYAMNHAKFDLARCLVDLGADPHAVALDPWRWGTPLQCAAENEQLDLVKLFLNMDAYPNEEPAKNYGATAIQIAAIKGNFEILELLIQAGSDINAPAAASQGRTALEGAAEHGRLDMAHHLLELGADVRGRTNRNYLGAVWLALDEGHRILACMIQDWKKQHYGEEDCEDFETIRKTLTYESW